MQPLLLLILLQAIWTGSYVAMKVALTAMPVGLVLILRIGIATLIFLLMGSFFRKNQFSRRDWLLILFVGIANFSFSPLFQLKSMELTQVIDVSVLVATEPVISALLASLILRERLTWETTLVFIIAAFGVVLLSGVTFEKLLNPVTAPRLLGNLFFLSSLLLEGINSVAGRRLTQRHDPLSIVAWLMGIGFLSNLALHSGSLASIPASLKAPTAWIAVGFLALFCSVVGYGGWYLLVKRYPVSQLALSLFLQPLFGIAYGVLLMGERVTTRTAIGALLVVGPLLIWVIRNLIRRTRQQTVTPLAQSVPGGGLEPPRF